MGACFSRTKGRRSQPSGFVGGCRDPPPEAEAAQEETVKEVLSETPKLKAPRPPKEEDVKIGREGGNEIVRDDRSEGTSEVCSVSEGFSISTSVSEVMGEERPMPASLVKFKRKRSSSSGEILLKRERMTGSIAAVRCGSGRSSPSPTRRREGVGGSGGRMCSARDASMAPKSRGNALCRDSGERSGRRSVSPVPKPTVGGQSKGVLAVRANGRSLSPLRFVGCGAVEGCRFGGGGGGGGGGKRKIEQDMVECGSSGGMIGSKESLENPLVSLECFIFL